MSAPDTRKIVVQIEECLGEMGKKARMRNLKVTVAAVIKNPLCGMYHDDLEPLKELGKQLGEILAKRGVTALEVVPAEVESYGKGAIVGSDGELEHAAAILHPRFGAPVRKAVHEGKDIIPGTKKVGGPGSTIVIPLTHKNNIWDFDHMDATENFHSGCTQTR